MTTNEIASVCHEANAAYCRTIGDESQPSWYMAPQWQVDSAVMGAERAMAGTLTPEQSHDSWMGQKLADGWKYGEKKNPVAKTHPCLLAYDMLPAEQKRKDKLFLAVVAALKD